MNEAATQSGSLSRPWPGISFGRCWATVTQPLSLHMGPELKVTALRAATLMDVTK
jgi:hypothetical protein